MTHSFPTPRSAALGGRPDIGAQFGLGRVIRNVAARISVAGAAPRGQAAIPDPAARLRGGDGMRRDRADLAGVGNLHRQRAIAEQDVIAVLECDAQRSEEHTSELQSPMRHSYAVFCLKKKKKT